MRSTMLLVLTLALVAGTARAGVSDAKWKEAVNAFKDDFKKKSIKFKKRAIEVLPVTDGRTIDFIIKDKKLLSHKDWWIRTTAAERLSKIKVPELRKQMLSFAKDSDKRIRAGIIAACAMSADRLDPPVILEALHDSAWEVRRMACWAAGQQRVREAVDPMIAMIHEVDPRTGRVVQEGETNPRVHSVLLFNLYEITGKYFHTDSTQWKQYWDRNKDKTLPPVRRFDVGSFGDVKLKFNDTFARKGSGPLVIALPEPHKTTTYYMPYFNQWMFVKWLYINLPPITSFPDVQYNSHGDPIYPVDILVDAFEDMRKKRNVEKMVLLGHGFSTWVAAKYAQKYPDRVHGLILINPYSSNELYGKAIDEAKRSGDPDAEFWGKVSSYEIRMGTPLEAEIYDYYRSTAYLAPKNRDDLELGMLRRVWRDPGATSIAIPEFDIRGEETSRIPALMFFAAKSNEMKDADGINRLNRYYPKHVTVKLRSKAARLPFMEDPETFEDALRTFIDKMILR
jgi:pimeloyl-ACP methyl ester carboxylesterase